MATKVSIVIVNWNAREDVLACLASLRENPPSCAYEVILVDNASADGSVAAVRARAPEVLVIANPTNRGLAAANNQGIAAAQGDVIVISNPDVLFLKTSIDNLVAAFDRHARAAFVFSRLRDADGGLQTSVGALPTLSQALRGRNRQRQVEGDPPFPDMWWDGWAHDQETSVGHGGEAFYAIRAAALPVIGVQDEEFFLDWEGVDWCARAWAKGWEVWFCPTSEVVHVGGRSIRKARFRWVVSSHRGMYRYFATRSSVIRRPMLALVIFTRAFLKLLALRAQVGSSDRYLRD